MVKVPDNSNLKYAFNHYERFIRLYEIEHGLIARKKEFPFGVRESFVQAANKKEAIEWNFYWKSVARNYNGAPVEIYEYLYLD